MLFSASAREVTTPKLSRESDFAFLDRSARPEIGRVRALIEQLLADYPPAHQAELIARIRSGDDVHFKSAVFELLLYSFLTKLGFILEVHPVLSNGSSSLPDFLVTTPDGCCFLLEAVLASANDGSDPAAVARMNTCLDALTKGGHQSFWVNVEWEGVPTSQPSGAKLRRSIVTWLDSLDPDKVQSHIENDGKLSALSHTWSHESWRVLVRPIPVPSARRGTTKTLVGALNWGAGWVDEWSPIRDALKFKGSKYGELNLPLLVAVNFSAFNLSRIDEVQALFGQEQFTVSMSEPDKEPSFSRAPNGAWHGKRGPESRQVSGAWIFNSLSAYTIATRGHTVYFNPWAANTLPQALKQLPHAIGTDGTLHWIEGVSLRQVFGLPEGWPGDA